MATTRIVRHVTQALIGILEGDLTVGPSPLIAPGNVRAAPPENIEDITASTLLVFLYQVIESPYLKNQGPKVKLTTSLTPVTQSDSLALDLYYLLIPGAGLGSYIDTYDILGAAMRSIHDHGIFTLGDWVDPGDLDPSEAALQYRIDFNHLDTGDLIRIWEAVHNPYRLSVSYVVRTVQIDSQLVESTHLVSERQFRMGQL